MDRDEQRLVVRNLQRFGEHGAPLRLIELHAGLLVQLVELRVDHPVRIVAAEAALARGEDGRQHAVAVHRRKRRPAEHVDVGLATIDFREIGRPAFRLQVDLHAGARPHGRDGDAGLLVRDVTVVRAGEARLEAVGIACFGEQLLRLVEIEAERGVERRRSSPAQAVRRAGRLYATCRA